MPPLQPAEAKDQDRVPRGDPAGPRFRSEGEIEAHARMDELSARRRKASMALSAQTRLKDVVP